MSEKVKTIYYSNELTDEFSTAQITPKYIDGKYEYIHNTLAGKIGHFFWYRMLVRPFGQAYMKLKFGHRIVNKHLLKEMKEQGFFLFGNHTNAVADAFIPSVIGFPTDAYVIVHPNNVSMPVLGKITPFLGALPLPDNMAAAKNFMKAVKQVITDGRYVVIYPEAHIWPYYTSIRPFTDASFGYPISCKADIYCFTNTYQKRRFCKAPRMVTYLDGPFTAPPNIPLKDQKKTLRDQVYETMKNRSKSNNVEKIRYCKAENK